MLEPVADERSAHGSDSERTGRYSCRLMRRKNKRIREAAHSVVGSLAQTANKGRFSMFSIGPQELVIVGLVVFLLLGLPLLVVFIVLYFLRRKSSEHD